MLLLVAPMLLAASEHVSGSGGCGKALPGDVKISKQTAYQIPIKDPDPRLVSNPPICIFLPNKVDTVLLSR
jgi:hypothetical protein